MRSLEAFLVIFLSLVLACSADEGSSKAQVCEDFCAAAKTCEEQAGEELEPDFMQSCSASCASGLGVQPPPSASEIQSCADAHIGTCDQLGFAQCIVGTGEPGSSPASDMLTILGLFEPFCEKNFECCGDPSPESFVQTVDECSSLMGGFFMLAVVPGQEAGYVEIDSQKLVECRDLVASAMASTTCDELGGSVMAPPSMDAAACSEWLIGKQQEGQSCTYVDPDDDEAMPTSSDSYCVKGLVCSRVEGLEEKQCAKGVSEGEACEGMLGPSCALGLVCSSEKICMVPGKIGDPCGDNDECADGLCSAEMGQTGECISEESEPCGDW